MYGYGRYFLGFAGLKSLASSLFNPKNQADTEAKTPAVAPTFPPTTQKNPDTFPARNNE
jgi:hypothetical protein